MDLDGWQDVVTSLTGNAAQASHCTGHSWPGLRRGWHGRRATPARGGQPPPWASHSQFHLAPPHTKLTHPVPKLNQPEWFSCGASAKMYLRKGSNCQGKERHQRKEERLKLGQTWHQSRRERHQVRRVAREKGGTRGDAWAGLQQRDAQAGMGQTDAQAGLEQGDAWAGLQLRYAQAGTDTDAGGRYTFEVYTAHTGAAEQKTRRDKTRKETTGHWPQPPMPPVTSPKARAVMCREGTGRQNRGVQGRCLERSWRAFIFVLFYCLSFFLNTRVNGTSIGN